MSAFRELILKSINDYKAILRRNLTANECMAKLRELGIKRNLLKQSDDVALYLAGKEVVKELRRSDFRKAEDNDKATVCHYGREDFLRYLEIIINDYRIENGAVINVKQRASQALVSAIQLVSLPKERLDSKKSDKLKDYTSTVVSYGTVEQAEILNRAIRYYEPHHGGFFSQLLSLFEDFTAENEVVT